MYTREVTYSIQTNVSHHQNVYENRKVHQNAPFPWGTFKNTPSQGQPPSLASRSLDRPSPTEPPPPAVADHFKHCSSVSYIMLFVLGYEKSAKN